MRQTMLSAKTHRPVTPESNAKPAPATGAGTSQPVKSTPATNPPTNTNTGNPVDSLQKKE